MHYFEPIPIGIPENESPNAGSVLIYFDLQGKQKIKKSDSTVNHTAYITGTDSYIPIISGDSTLINSPLQSSGGSVMMESGNFGVGLTVPAARIHIEGLGNTSATHSFIVDSSSVFNLFFVRDDGAVSSKNGYWINSNKILDIPLGSAGADARNTLLWNSGAGFPTTITGGSNVFVGGARAQALPTMSGNYNTVLGFFDLTPALTTGSSNIFVGYGAGSFETTVNRYINISTNSADAGYFQTDGNIRIGVGIGPSGVHDIYNNISIGHQASRTNHGSNVIAIGGGANAYNATGANVVVVGNGANGGTGNWGSGSRSSNRIVAIGDISLGSNYADNNVGIGHQAGYLNTTGSGNIFIGYKAGMNSTTDSDVLYIDNQDRTSNALEKTNALIYGVFHASPASQYLALNANVTIQSLRAAYVEKTSTYTIKADDFTINCISGTFTLTLPTAVGIKGRIYIIKNSSTDGSMTLEGDGSETVEGDPSITILTATSAMVQSDGANWVVLFS
jgi:hypothetical protein